MMKNAMMRWLGLLVVAALGVSACDQTPVELPEATSLVVSPASMTLYAGEMAALTAQVLDQNGQVLQGAEAAWSSSAPAVAAVIGDQVTAMAPGSATLQATYGSQSATVNVTVLENTSRAASVDVMTGDLELHVADGVEYISFSVVDERGRTNCWGETGATVSSSDEAVAEASISGSCRVAVYPQFNGTATITLNVDGVTTSFEVTVVSNQYGAFWTGTPNEWLAGDTVEYVVRVVDQENQGVEGQTVNFSVNLGHLVSISTATDADGYATALWVLPEILGESSAFEDYDNGMIAFRTALPSGEESGNSFVSVRPAEPASFQLYRWDTDTGQWLELDGSTVTAATGDEVRIAAGSYDEYGNRRYYGNVYMQAEPSDPGSFSTTANGSTMINGYYTRYAGYRSTTAQTATVSVYDQGFDGYDPDTDFSTSIDIIWEDPA